MAKSAAQICSNGEICRGIRAAAQEKTQEPGCHPIAGLMRTSKSALCRGQQTIHPNRWKYRKPCHQDEYAAEYLRCRTSAQHVTQYSEFRSVDFEWKSENGNTLHRKWFTRWLVSDKAKPIRTYRPILDARNCKYSMKTHAFSITPTTTKPTNLSLSLFLFDFAF